MRGAAKKNHDGGQEIRDAKQLLRELGVWVSPFEIRF